MIRILVADDHPLVRKGIIKTLKDYSKLLLIDEVGNGEDAIIKAAKHDYEIIILDISMPLASGLKALEQILMTKPDSKIIMLSVFDDQQYITHSFKLGAKAYITKSDATNELGKAIKKVRTGGKYISFDLAEEIALNLDDHQRPLHQKLTKREFQVFCLIAQGKKTGEIASYLSINPKTVTTFIGRLKRKMHFSSSYEIIKYALANNLV